MFKPIYRNCCSIALLAVANCAATEFVHAQENDLATHNIDELHWLAGSWYGRQGRAETEENWIAPNGGMMLATNRTANGDKGTFEFLRIQQRQSSIVYFASPGGKTPVEFKLIDLGNQKAVFENEQNDFPQRIIYHRVEKKMNVVIEGQVDGKIQRVEWSWKLRK